MIADAIAATSAACSGVKNANCVGKFCAAICCACSCAARMPGQFEASQAAPRPETEFLRKVRLDRLLIANLLQASRQRRKYITSDYAKSYNPCPGCHSSFRAASRSHNQAALGPDVDSRERIHQAENTHE